MSPRYMPRAAPLLAISLCATSLAACALFGIDPERIGLQAASATSRPFTTSVAREEPKPTRSVAARPGPRPPASPAEGEPCSEGADCMARLRSMVANPDRSWIGRPESLPSFADGTRLFAYRTLRAQLSCRELALALADVKTASRLLVHSHSGVALDRARKAAVLATDVAGELRSEHDDRCRTPNHPASATRQVPKHSQ